MTRNTYIVVLCEPGVTALRAVLSMLTPSLVETRVPARGPDPARRVPLPQRARSGRVAHSSRFSLAFERFGENHHRAQRARQAIMSVVKVIALSAQSTQGHEDTICQALERAAHDPQHPLRQSQGGRSRG